MAFFSYTGYVVFKHSICMRVVVMIKIYQGK